MAERFKERKVKPHDSDFDPQCSGFNETVKFTVLHCGNVEGNNNKFYCLELQKNKSGYYRLFSHYGRLGISEVFGIRDIDQSTGNIVDDITIMEKEFDAIIKKKLRGKNVKDDRGLGESRREKYEEVKTFSPKVGSENIRGKSVTVQTSKTAKIDTSTIANPKIVKLIDQIVDENIHNITSLTSLTLTSSGFETPLGPVTKEQIQNARNTLDILKSFVKRQVIDDSLQDVRDANNMYYSLIPHQFSHKITKTDWILNDQKLMQEFDLIEQLESAIQMGSALGQNATKRLNAIGIDIDELTETQEINRIIKYVETSKAQNHRGLDIYKYKVKNIFIIKIPNERSRFELTKTKYGNIKELFHGSKTCNILSILKNGLIIPPCNCPTFSGRAFGDGCYFANASTKSLNYSTNFWNSNYTSCNENIFLFLAKVAMGKYYETKSCINRVPIGYDSIWAKSGQSLYNDEFIVPRLEQQTITHIIELTK